MDVGVQHQDRSHRRRTCSAADGVFGLSQPSENVRGTVNGFVELYIDTFGEASDTWEVFEVTWPSDGGTSVTAFVASVLFR